MAVLPKHILDHMNDFRFGNVSDWKTCSNHENQCLQYQNSRNE